MLEDVLFLGAQVKEDDKNTIIFASHPMRGHKCIYLPL